MAGGGARAGSAVTAGREAAAAGGAGRWSRGRRGKGRGRPGEAVPGAGGKGERRSPGAETRAGTGRLSVGTVKWSGPGNSQCFQQRAADFQRVSSSLSVTGCEKSPGTENGDHLGRWEWKQVTAKRIREQFLGYCYIRSPQPRISQNPH